MVLSIGEYLVASGEWVGTEFVASCIFLGEYLVASVPLMGTQLVAGGIFCYIIGR